VAARKVQCWNCAGSSRPAKFKGKSAAMKCAACSAAMTVTRGRKFTKPFVPELKKSAGSKKIAAPAFLAKGGGTTTRAEAVGSLRASLRRYQEANPPLVYKSAAQLAVRPSEPGRAELTQMAYHYDPMVAQAAWARINGGTR
jgi:hypothetical protein